MISSADSATLAVTDPCRFNILSRAFGGDAETSAFLSFDGLLEL